MQLRPLDNGVLVLGASGMLGSTLMRTLPGALRVPVTGTARSQPPAALKLDPARVRLGVDASDFASIEAALDAARPAVLINCIGLIKQLDEGKQAIPCIQINALLPHRLYQACQARGIRVVHISTDCVFSGRTGMYTESDLADPPDWYGQSKLMGELAYPGSLTLRTSIIGHEATPRALSLVDWFLAASGPVKGFRRAIYSGLPTAALAAVIADALLKHAQLSGLYHVSADAIDKYELLRIVQRVYAKTDVQIEADDSFVIDRSLDSSLWRSTTGWTPPTWEQLIASMHEDYKQWH